MELKEFAETILYGSTMGEKLFSPERFSDEYPGGFSKSLPSLPPRPSFLKWNDTQNRSKFPSLAAFESEQTRGHILHFFANHELLALELMALALLKFPNAPAAFRANVAQTMLEEQFHLRLYLERMAELGVAFGDLRVNRFFWDCLKGMQSPIDYVAGMSLTFEQANLDYASFYLKHMQQLGDERTAGILKKVLEDEIGHVKFGVSYFQKQRSKDQSFFDAYLNQLAPPLTAARAKGQWMNTDARRKAGFSESDIEALRVYGASKGRPPNIFWYNSDCEIEWMVSSKGYHLPQKLKVFVADLAPLMGFLSKPGDVVLCSGAAPSVFFLNYLGDYGFKPPEFISCTNESGTCFNAVFTELKHKPHLGEFRPWGWTPSTMQLARSLGRPSDIPELLADHTFKNLPTPQLPERFFRKDMLLSLRRLCRDDLMLSGAFSSPDLDGRVCGTTDDVLSTIKAIWSEYGVAAVVKASYGAAGSGIRRFHSERDFSASHLGWLKRQLKLSGQLLVEPWLEKICEFSYVYQSYDGAGKGSVRCFMTDAKGRYVGHKLGRWWSQLDAGVCQLFFDRPDKNTKSAFESINLIGLWVGNHLKTNGYKGPCGIDFFVFKHPQTKAPTIKLISEINPRFTMGHIASGLDKIFCKKADIGQWSIINEADWLRLGYKSAEDLGRKILSCHKNLSGDQALIITNDWTVAQKSITVLARGKGAIEQLDFLLLKQADLRVGRS